MRKLLACLLLTSIFLGCSSEDTPPEPVNLAPIRVLVFTKTTGYYHPSIAVGVEAIRQLGRENNFRVDTTKMASRFQLDTLRKYKAVVFLSTTGDVLNPAQQTAFEQYIRLGNGFVGVHAATDCEYDWPWYNGLVGAYFSNHPNIQSATVQVTNRTHSSTSFLPPRWTRTDEWYNFRNMVPDLQVLATLDESTYSGGSHAPNPHPIAWYHTYDGGRAFYTAGGHTDDSFREPLFLRHLLGGIAYAVGQ